MIQIVCKSGKAFVGCSPDFIDAEWKLQEAWYKAQGCIVSEVESMTLEQCDCDHCKSLDHSFDELIQEIKDEEWN